MLSLKDQCLRDCVSNYYICNNFCNRHKANARVMQTHPVSSMMQPPQDSMHSHSSPVNNRATKGGRKTKTELQFAPAPAKPPRCHSTPQQRPAKPPFFSLNQWLLMPAI